MGEILEWENKFYVAVNSSYTDDRTKVLNHIDTFGIFDRWGDVKQLGEEVQGIYHNGMRHLSGFEVRLNGKRPLLLSSSVKDENEILSVDLTNPHLVSPAGKNIPRDVLHIGRSKFIRNGNCYEQICINNYGHEQYEFDLSVSFDADFKDIFEVRGIKREKRGEISAIRHLPEGRGVEIRYSGLDGRQRLTVIRFSRKPDYWNGHNKAVFKFSLAPQQGQSIDFSLHFLIDNENYIPGGFEEAKQKLQRDLEIAASSIAKLKSSDEQFNTWLNRSQNDLLSLLAETGYGRYPYAGVPWYNTAFGRDGIITALETLWVAPEIARDVLRYLANTQATCIDEYKDAEPGKIIHEVRGGEMAELREIPFRRYYGSVDATPLFVMLAGAYFQRTADVHFIRSIWPNVKAALEWINTYGDTDKDGFVEYQRKSINGLANQGWKDSHDSIMHEDGSLAPFPIALCEVQAYVYDAKIQAAHLAEVVGEKELSETLMREAKRLKEQFNEKFWDEELGYYVLALDGNKKPCRVISSNAGHCLLTSIADKDKAEKVAERMFRDDMFSGWGIRTLSMNEKRYNPMSYHNGSVWPHDVALIARGLSKYGYTKEAVKLTNCLFDAASFLEYHRLPELFCGFSRRKGEGPTHYPVACSPQAWSVGAAYLLLEACLHIDIYAEQKKVYFYQPVLPMDIDMLEIKGLKLGDHYANLRLHSENGSVGVKVESCPPGWQVFLITGSEKEE